MSNETNTNSVNKPALSALLLPELETMLAGLSNEFSCPIPGFRCAQIYKWITRGALDFDKMTDIPLSLREEIKKYFTISSSRVTGCQKDKSAVKLVISLIDELKIEAVLLSDGRGRFTACLSTQAGCPGGCVFCKTGSLGFLRNLDSHEIIEQFYHLQSALENTERKIDNIVIMGMGEPLLNLAELRKAIAVITDPQGMNFSRRRITVSTCGICKGLFDIAENGPYIRLALSLTTASEPLRQKLMPITFAHPLKKVKEALVLFQRKGGGRITLEAALLGGINTRAGDAASIAEFANGLDTVINLIPWNPASGLEFEGKPLREPDKKETENYKTMLESRGLKVTMRLHKGRRVLGACGQLGGK